MSNIVFNKSKDKKKIICINGTNTGSIYDVDDKVYYVEDNIILEMNNIKYKLVEYHLDDKNIHNMHYIFVELGSIYKKFNLNTKKYFQEKLNDINGSVIIISKTYKKNPNKKLQIKSPVYYYEYDDDTILTGDFSPTKYIIYT